jgi:TRAP-type transport system periplasmic protein
MFLSRRKSMLLASVFLGFIHCFSVYANPQQLFLGHRGAPDSMFDLLAREFARRVNQRLAGRYEVVTKGGSILGDEGVMLSLVKNGQLEFCLPYSILAKTMPAFAAFDLPYLVLTRKHIREVREPLLNKYLIPEARSKGFALLAMWDDGFRHVTNNVRPIETPRDLKGLTMRIAPASWKARVFEKLGVAFKEVPLMNVREALRNHEADAQESPLSTLVTQRYFEVQKYLSLTAHTYQPIFLMTSAEHFSRLDKDAQAVIARAAKGMEDWSLELGEKQEAKLLSAIKDKMTVNEPDKFAFLLASIPIYQAYAKENPAEAPLVKLLYDPSAFGIPLALN